MDSEAFLDFYALLDISPASSSDAIKEAFRSKLRYWHPDVNKSPKATQVTQHLIVAYKILLDSEARDRYNCQYYGTYAKTSEDVDSNFPMDGSTVYDDPILSRWVASARRAAEDEWKTFSKDFLDAGMAVRKQAGSGLWMIVLWVLGFIIAFSLKSARK